MPFCGYTEYTLSGKEDVANQIALFAAEETKLLDWIGDGSEDATNVYHQWVEDALLDINSPVSGSTTGTAVQFPVDDGTVFQVGDIIRGRGEEEVMYISAISGNYLTVTRGYGGTTASDFADDTVIEVIASAAIEGDSSRSSREKTRTRAGNYTHILDETIFISNTMENMEKYGIPSEVQYQYQKALMRKMTELERAILYSYDHATTPQGSSSVRRTLNGLAAFISTNVTNNGGTVTLTEARLNTALRSAWDNGARNIDTIVVNGFNKRIIDTFVTPSSRYYQPTDERFKAVFGVYESSFGIQNVILCKNCDPSDVFLLDRNRLAVVPFKGRNFQLQTRTFDGDAKKWALIGEYTLEVKNQKAHARIKGTTVS